jgi:hypothetical protein
MELTYVEEKVIKNRQVFSSPLSKNGKGRS